jgi:SNF2 family DNA or RNA helicase
VQYVSTIEWLKTALTAAGFGYRFISGSMPLKQRAKAINAFQQDPPTTGEAGMAEEGVGGGVTD